MSGLNDILKWHLVFKYTPLVEDGLLTKNEAVLKASIEVFARRVA